MSAKQYRKNAITAFKGQLIPILICVVIYEAIIFGISLIPLVGTIISLLCQGPLIAGICYVALQAIRRQSVTINSLFVGFKNIINFFLLELLNTIFVVLWTLLLVIPGIMKAYSYSMSYFILLDNPGMDQGTARTESMRMMQGHRKDLFLLHLSFIGWIILGSLIAGLIISPFAYLMQYNPFLYGLIASLVMALPMLFILPYMLIATAGFYNSLSGEDLIYDDESVDRKPILKGFGRKNNDDYDDYDDDEF